MDQNEDNNNPFRAFDRNGRPDWDGRFMRLALELGSWSKDRSRGIGCVIVGPNREIRASGFNGFPRKLDDDIEKRHQRPDKYKWTEHAERNAIYNAARVGTPLEGCTIYIPWFPCVDCTRAIIQAGISEMVAFRPDLSDLQWGKDFQIALEMLKEANVTVRFVR